MRKAGRALTSLLNLSIAVTLAVMSVLVFLNVVLRYLFNSGITWSEELSRFLFVWMVFLGAIAALKEKMHLGVDLLVERLPERGKKLCSWISHLLMLFVLWLLLDGSWKLTMLNLNSRAPATGIPLAFVYGIGIVTSLSMAVILINNLYRSVIGRPQASADMGKPDMPADQAAAGTKGGV